MKSFKGDYVPSRSFAFILTLIFLGPIIWFLINIHDKNVDNYPISIILVLISLYVIISQWVYYFKYKKTHKEFVKEKNRKNLLVIPLLIITCVAVIVLFVFLNIGIEKIMAPKDYLFYEMNMLASKVMILFLVLSIIIIGLFLLKKFKINKTETLDIYLDLFNKYKIIYIVMFLVVSYIFVTSITFVCEDKIVYHSPLHPAGITYNYTDVDKINTAFGDKNFSLFDYNRKGNFYYQIEVGGNKITFSTPSINTKIDEYRNNSYLELEVFDKNLVSLSVKKESSDKNKDLCKLDKEYCDRFIRIINNK